ncbi:MAG TPA: hypothetical protein VK206_00545 [Anaerolineales bacterium]|jgi:hypothetical protein|nr:hypothetical protein [Anaerolineales bacterium]
MNQQTASTTPQNPEALEKLEQALNKDDPAAVDRQLWNARRELLKLQQMIERERAN